MVPFYVNPESCIYTIKNLGLFDLKILQFLTSELKNIKMKFLNI